MRKITSIFILVVGVIIAVYDVWVIQAGGTGASISMVIINWSYKYPILTFSLGVICGHLFWRTGDTKETKHLGKGV